MHAAFISGSCQPEGRSAVKVGKLIGVPRRFTALPPPLRPASHHFLSFLLFSSIVFQLFEKWPRSLSAKQTIPLEFNDLVYSPAKVIRYIWKKEAIVRLAFRSFYFLAGRLSTFQTFPRYLLAIREFEFAIISSARLSHTEKVFCHFEIHIFEPRLISCSTN